MGLEKELLQLIEQFCFADFNMAGDFCQDGVECSNAEVLVPWNRDVMSTLSSRSRQTLVASRLSSLLVTELAELAGK